MAKEDMWQRTRPGDYSWQKTMPFPTMITDDFLGEVIKKMHENQHFTISEL